MKLTVRPDSDDPIQIAVTGQVTQRELIDSTDPLHKLIGDEGYGRHVELDMGDVGYLDSSGVGWLLSSHKKFRQSGGKLVLKSLTPVVANVVRVLKLEKVLNLAEEGANRTAAGGTV